MSEPAPRPAWLRCQKLACALFLGALAALSGCASSGTSSSSSEYMTSSDMTDERRRAIIRLQLAAEYMGNGQYEIALDEVKRAIAADPGYSIAYNMRGLAYVQLGEKSLAEESFRRALALNNRDGDAQHNLAFVLCEQGRYSEARQFFEAAHANPTYRNKDRTRVAQAVCETKTGNFAGAESLLISLYEEGGRSPQAASALADLYVQQRDYRKAALYASQANVRSSATPASLWQGIKIERQLGNTETVTRYARQLRESFPDSRELQLYERGAWNN
ncbi:MAG: type IV pilus biogenesis/stability protein PilW [Brachymonas sp.]|nr:type IV pilus biogenesis/stability protein PilW [Brachymonas sp.]